jgi:hypothetical protein
MQTTYEHELHCGRAEKLEKRMDKAEETVNQIRATWNVTKVLVPLSALAVFAHTVWQLVMDLRGGR